MPRPFSLDRPTRLELKLPTSIRARVDLHLHSDLEGRVPAGAYQSFFIERIKEFFEWGQLDLEPYGFPAGTLLRAPKSVLLELQRRLSA